MYQGPVHGTRKIAMALFPLSGIKSLLRFQPRNASYGVSCHFAYKHGKINCRRSGCPEAQGWPELAAIPASLLDTYKRRLDIAAEEWNNLATELSRPDFARYI